MLRIPLIQQQPEKLIAYIGTFGCIMKDSTGASNRFSRNHGGR